MKSSRKFLAVFSLVLLASLIFAPAALAFDGRNGDRIVIGANEVINDDLYLAGTEVIVDGTINGDLMVAAQDVTINGTVTGDLWVAGRSVTVNGAVGDDLFTAAAAVTLGSEARITDDVFGGAGSIESKAGSQVGGAIIIGAGQALLSGNIAEDLKAGSNRIRLEGTVGGDATLGVDSRDSYWAPNTYFGPDTPAMPSVPSGLTFGEGAKVAGILEYTSPDQQSVPSSVSTQVQYRQPPVDAQVSREISRNDGLTSSLLDNVRRLIALLVVGLLVAWLFPAWILTPARRLMERPLPSFGVGLLGLVAFPGLWFVALGLIILVAVIFGALTLGGLLGSSLALGLSGLGAVTVLFFLMLGYLPQAIVAYIGGRWLLQRLSPASADNRYWAMVVGLIVLAVLISLPILGGLLQFLAILVGLGAILLVLWDKRPQAAPAAVQA
jgi:cytoskeletal protein CcmA (bactofilin family)